MNASRGEHGGGRHPVRPRRVRDLAAERAQRQRRPGVHQHARAEVTRPTSECQLGNGSRNSSPNRNAMIRLNHGMPFLSTLAKSCG